jgi:hypothetical protein
MNDEVSLKGSNIGNNNINKIKSVSSEVSQ